MFYLVLQRKLFLSQRELSVQDQEAAELYLFSKQVELGLILPEVNNTFPTEFNKDRIKSVLSTVTYKKKKNVENRNELGLQVSEFLSISLFL